MATHPTIDIVVRHGPLRRGDRTARSARTATLRSTSTSRHIAFPGTDVTRTQRGFFARLRLERFGPDSGVRPHERTLSGAKEDRYKLLRATGVNTSPVVGLYDDPSGEARAVLDRLTAGAPDIDIVDDDGTRHRLWAVPADGDDARRSLRRCLLPPRGSR